ncbi:hypothetical protein [Trichoplusia ni ascovirus 6b]|nr:hypothetical protein [Trichoplusia ni ascovirus 6b]
MIIDSTCCFETKKCSEFSITKPHLLCLFNRIPDDRPDSYDALQYIVTSDCKQTLHEVNDCYCRNIDENCLQSVLNYILNKNDNKNCNFAADDDDDDNNVIALQKSLPLTSCSSRKQKNQRGNLKRKLKETITDTTTVTLKRNKKKVTKL